MIINILLAAVLACIIETIIVLAVLKQDQLKNLLLNIVLINLITNLTLNLSIMLLTLLGVNATIFVIIAELAIPIVEFFMFKYCYPKLNKRKLFLTCCLANVVSFSISFLI